MGNWAIPNLASGAAAPPAKTSTSRNQPVFAAEEITVGSAALTLGALFGSIRVPKGAVIKGVHLKATDLDSDGTPAVVLAVGDADDDDRLITGSSVGQAGGYSNTLAPTGFGHLYTEETLIQVKVTTAPTAAANGTITYGVEYVSP